MVRRLERKLSVGSGCAPIEENVDDDAVEEIPEGHKGVPEREAMRFGERCSEHEDE